MCAQSPVVSPKRFLTNTRRKQNYTTRHRKQNDTTENTQINMTEQCKKCTTMIKVMKINNQHSSGRDGNQFNH